MNYLLRLWNFSDAGSIVLILISALCGSIGAFFLLLAYRTGNPSVSTPFKNTGLISTMLLGFIIWNDIPTKTTRLGKFLIVGCGLYLVFKENLSKTEKGGDSLLIERNMY